MIGQLENSDELLSYVMTECDSLSFDLKDSEKKPQDVKADFFSVTLEKKVLVEQMIKQDAEICSLCVEVTRL